MKETKQKLEKWYEKEDPWNYKKKPHAIKRKEIILKMSAEYCGKILKKDKFENALEIGAGEGWITKDLPAHNIYGYELSENAKSRWPKNINDFDSNIKYDLIIAPGVLYEQYNYRKFLNLIREYSSGVVMTLAIKSWEINDLKKQIYETEFQHKQYIQKLRIYDATQGGL
tara:strand:- start:109 stop:618 length:510 start_codon:yes stop_codon:yes gene_type:complete